MMSKPEEYINPIQPLYETDNGVIRFKENKIVRYLLDNGGIDMNQLACLEFNDNDREQFAQLIGYSHSGFGELSYVSNETYEAAENIYEEGCTDQEARLKFYRDKFNGIKDNIKNLVHLTFDPKDHEDI